MKTKLIIIIITFSYINVIKSQCDNNVSTDYNGTPTNNALPSNSPSPSYGNQFLNSFDWVPRNGSQNLEKYQSTNMTPGLLVAGEAENIYSSALGQKYSYLYGDLEPLPENGWELISVNLGYFPNGNVQSPTSSYQDFPYLILYNKYRSVMRVFGILGPGYAAYGTSISAVVVKLMFDNNSDNFNGLLRYSSGTDKTLDQTTDINRIASVVHHPNQQGKWFSADFHLAYDPCVCFMSSDLRLEFDFIETADIDAQINSLSIEDDIVENGSGLKDVDFLNNFNYDPTGVTDEFGTTDGYLIYHGIENMLSNYINELEDYVSTLAAIGKENKEVKRRMAILKGLEYVITVGSVILTGAPGAIIKPLLEQFAPNLIKSSENKIILNLLSKESEKILGKSLKFLISENWVGETVSDLPDKPIRPAVTYSQSRMKGTITRTTQNYNGPKIPTPGTYGGDYTGSSPSINTPHNYPVYNEALGVFALLESPKIKISKSYHNYDNEVVNDFLHEEWVNVRQIQLDEPLKYAINPSLDIQDVDIQCSFVSHVSFGVEPQFYQYLTVWLTNDPQNGVNAEFTPLNIDEADTVAHQHPQHVGSLDVRADSMVMSSAFVPIDALSGYVHSVGLHNENLGRISWSTGDPLPTEPEVEGYSYEIDSVFLKMIITVNYEGNKSDGSPHKYTYMQTYKVDDNNITLVNNNPLLSNLPGSSADITQYSEYLYFNDIDFDGSTIEGCELNGMQYTCKAWNDIYLEGTFTVTSGYDVDIIAGNEIIVDPESDLSPEMVLSIEPVLDLSNPMPAQNSAAVKTFCEDTDKYKARLSTKTLQVVEEHAEEAPEIPEESLAFDFNLYPNPATDEITVSMMWEAPGEASLYLSDLSGKRIMTILEPKYFDAGSYRYTVNTSNLASGFYMVTLQKGKTTKVKRLVIQ